MRMDYYQIGKRIRRYRKAYGLSQEVLAERVNISATHMSHIETGNTKLSLAVLVDIAAALDVQTDALIYDAPMSGKPLVVERVQKVLDACTEEQALVIMETMESLKISLDKHSNAQ